MTLEILTSDLLAGARHGFFTRRGGASSGVYAGLNCGPGSRDQREAVRAEPRPGRRGDRACRRTGCCRCTRSIRREVVVAGPEGWTERPARRRGGDRPAGPRAQRADRRLRAGAARRPRGRGDRRGPCRLARRARRRARGDARGDGAAWARAASRSAPRSGRRSASAPTRSARSSSSASSTRTPGYDRFFVTGAGDRLHFDLPGFVLARLREAGVGEAGMDRRLHLLRPGAVLLLPPRPPTPASRTTAG